MKTTLCTLYNSLYLDKGLVLYDSLKECAKDFVLYVLCMDDKCYEVLSDIGETNMIPIKLEDFEDENLIKVKSTRSFAEYCWTCTPAIILYVLNRFREPTCTYIDADMYFYHDPQILVNEMIESGASVMMVPHRFTERNQYLASHVGTYCVEFNCFKNDAAGWEVLNHWHNKCLECCCNLEDGIHYGDQKYMDEWPIMFPDKVHVCEHVGAGLAPWNIEWYQDYWTDHTIFCRMSGLRVPIIFYHFQHLEYIKRKQVDTSIIKGPYVDSSAIEAIYIPYLKRIDNSKDFLCERFGIDFIISHHPAEKNNLLKFFLKQFKLSWWLYEKLKHKKPFIIELDKKLPKKVVLKH